MRVQAAAVLTFALVVGPFARREIHVAPISRWLVRFHAGAADLWHQQAADREGVVAHELGVEAETALARNELVVRIALAQFRRAFR